MKYSNLIHGEAGHFEGLPTEAQDQVMSGDHALQRALGAARPCRGTGPRAHDGGGGGDW